MASSPLYIPSYDLPIPVYFATSMNWKGKTSNADPISAFPKTVPFGFLPCIVDGGGRFDSNPGQPGWQEDSFWVGGYGGPRLEIDQSKLATAFSDYLPGTLYCFDVEHVYYDIRNASDATVQATIDMLKTFYRSVVELRPDMIFGLYNFAANPDFVTPSNWAQSLEVYNRYIRGEDITGDEWWIDKVAVVRNNRWVWDNTRPHAAAHLAWQRANTRLTHDTEGGKKIPNTYGLVGQLRVVMPALYDIAAGNDAEMFIKHFMAETHRVSLGRPVIPFVYPRYHESNEEVGGDTIPEAEWRQQIRWAIQYGAEGLVLWGAEEAEHSAHMRIVLEEVELASRTPQTNMSRLLKIAQTQTRFQGIPSVTIGVD